METVNIKVGLHGELERALGKRRENISLSPEDRLERRKIILAALARAAEDAPVAPLAADGEDGSIWYKLTSEQMEALIKGNIEEIRAWVSSLDRRHAAWLLRRLIEET